MCKRELHTQYHFYKKPESPDGYSLLCKDCLKLTNLPDYRGFQEEFTCRLCGNSKLSKHFFEKGKKRILCNSCREIPNAASMESYFKLKRENPEALKIYQCLQKRKQRSRKTMDKVDLLVARIKPLMMECLKEYFENKTI